MRLHISVVGLCSESLSHGDHDGQTKGVYDGPLQVPRTKASSMIALISLGGPTQLVPECEGTMDAAASCCVPFQFYYADATATAAL